MPFAIGMYSRDCAHLHRSHGRREFGKAADVTEVDRDGAEGFRNDRLTSNQLVDHRPVQYQSSQDKINEQDKEPSSCSTFFTRVQVID